MPQNAFNQLIGQATSANSTPVVLASDQSAIPVTVTPSTSGGAAIYRNLNVGATGASVKGTPGQAYGYVVGNQAGATRWLKLYNKATAPTVGTDTPVMTVQLPPGVSTGQFAISDGIAFGLGIGVGATQLLADADTTAPNANDVVLNLFYL